MSYLYAEDENNLLFKPIEAYIDAGKSIRFINDELSSINFDGIIPAVTASIQVSDVNGGYHLGVYDNDISDYIYYPIVRVEREDPDGPSYTGYHEIFYLQDKSIQSASFSSSADVVVIIKEDWDQKYIGTSGWLITQQGNAIFSNVAVRGDLEATTLDVGGANGITYNGSAVVIGTGVTILGTTTTDSLLVGASPNILKISASPNGVPGQDGIYINEYNYWYTDGQFGVGGSAGSAKWTGSALSITGNINATSGQFTGSVSAQTITASNGNIGGFTLASNQLSASQITLSSSGGLRLGASNEFSVDQSGNLVATSASITGNIIANSGTFTGSVSAQTITASNGSIAGFALADNQLSATNIILSSSGGLRLGNSSQFSVDQSGNLVATTASISGNINATSGSFSGDITAAAGRFTGSVTVSSGGKFIAGTPTNGVVLDDTGLTGYNNGLTMFNIPTTGSPTLAGFTVINTGITGSGAYANIIAGTASDGIIIRGDKATSSAAIYTVLGGNATTATSNNGFYVDELGRFRLAGSNGSLTFDGNNLSITGSVYATSGSFSGSVSAQHISASTGSIGGFGLSASSLTASAGPASAVGITTGASAIFAGATSTDGSGAKFLVLTDGSMFSTAASISGRISAASGTIGGFTLSDTSVTAGTGTDNYVGMSTGASAFFAGADSATPSNAAPFWVSRTGSVFAQAASISGNINATGGRFDGHIIFGITDPSDLSAIGYNLNDNPAAQPSANGTEYGFKLDAYNYWFNKQVNSNTNNIFLLATTIGDDYLELDDFGTLTFQATGVLNPGSELGGWTVGNGILYTGTGTTFNAISAGDSGGTYQTNTIAISKMIIDDEFYTYFDPNFTSDRGRYSTFYLRCLYTSIDPDYTSQHFDTVKELLRGSEITFSGITGDGSSLNTSLSFKVAEVVSGSYSLDATSSSYTVGGLTGSDKRVTHYPDAASYFTILIYGEDASPSPVYTGSTQINSSTAYAHDPSVTESISGAVVIKGDFEVTDGSFTYTTFANTGTNAFLWAGDEDVNNALFKVENDGTLTAQAANFTGTIDFTGTQFRLSSADSDKPDIVLTSTGPFGNSGNIYFTKNRSSGIVANNDDTGQIVFSHGFGTSTPTTNNIATILAEVSDTTASSGKLRMLVYSGNVNTGGIYILPGTTGDTSKVGINTSGPDFNLDVQSTLRSRGNTFLSTNTGSVTYIGPTAPISNASALYVSGNIYASGSARVTRLGINANPSGSDQLFVSGTASITGITKIAGAASALSSLYVGDTSVLSDAASALTTLYVGSTASIVSNIRIGGTASIVSTLILGANASVTNGTLVLKDNANGAIQVYNGTGYNQIGSNQATGTVSTINFPNLTNGSSTRVITSGNLSDIYNTTEWTTFTNAAAGWTVNTASYRQIGEKVEFKGRLTKSSQITSGDAPSSMTLPAPNNTARIPISVQNSPFVGRISITSAGSFVINVETTTSTVVYLDGVSYYTSN